MIDQAKFAHFLMLGQAADRVVSKLEKLAPSESLLIGPQHDLARMLPEHLRDANRASVTFKLFFVFENYPVHSSLLERQDVTGLRSIDSARQFRAGHGNVSEQFHRPW